MSMSSFFANLLEMKMAARWSKSRSSCRFLILFLFGGIDFMNALYQWNAAAKAVEIGARIAAVSDPIASGLTSIADDALSSGLASGSPMPDFTVECDGGAAACSARAAHATAWVPIRPTRWGSSSMGEPAMRIARRRPLNISPACATSIAAIAPQYVTVVYKQTGLGYAGRSLGPVPTITVSLNARFVQDQAAVQIFLPAVRHAQHTAGDNHDNGGSLVGFSRRLACVVIG